MIIRRISRADAPRAAQLDRSVFEDGWSDEMYLSELEKEHAHCFVCEDGDCIAGLAILWCICGTADVVRIAVAPDMRRRGIARKLLGTLSGTAREHGCSRIMLEVNETNTAARALYLSFGFCEIGTRKNYYGRHSAVLMEKKLE